MQCFQNSSVFASKEKNKEQIITCGISKQLCVKLQLSSCHLKNGKFASFIRTPLTGHLFFWDIWVAPAYLPLEVFIFGKGSGMVSCLAKRVKYQLLQGETILEHLHA